MTQLPGQREGLPALLQSLLGIAEHPKSLGQKAQAARARVMAPVEKGMRAVLTAIIVSDRLLQVCPCSRPISEEGVGPSQRVVRLQQEPRVLRALGQTKHLLSQIQSCPDLAARDMEETSEQLGSVFGLIRGDPDPVTPSPDRVVPVC